MPSIPAMVTLSALAALQRFNLFPQFPRPLIFVASNDYFIAAMEFARPATAGQNAPQLRG
jgi:hypothetical protein